MAKNEKDALGVGDSAQVQVVQVTIDMTDERLLQFNQDPKVRLEWSEDGFRELAEVIERQLSYDNVKSYLVAKQHVKERAAKAVETITGFEPARLQLQDWATYRLKIRERRGWHPYWASPGADFDMRMALGVYKQVRKHKVDGKDNDLEPNVRPGDETGEVLKLLDGEGKVELIALECPEEFYSSVIADMSSQSVARYKNQNESFAETIEEEVNTRVPKDHRMKVYGEGDREIKV
jgi:hypothetical protein